MFEPVRLTNVQNSWGRRVLRSNKPKSKWSLLRREYGTPDRVVKRKGIKSKDEGLPFFTGVLVIHKVEYK